MDAKGSVAKLVKTVDYRDFVHYKSGGSTGQKWPVGTWQDPCGSLSDVRAILAARNLDNVWVHGAVVLDADMTYTNFFGNTIATESIDLNGKSANISIFRDLKIIGSALAAGTNFIAGRNCEFYLIDNAFRIWAENCAITGTVGHPITLASLSVLTDCFACEGSTKTYISYVGADRLTISGWRGNLVLQGLLAGGVAYVDGIGDLDVDGTGGTVTVRGDIHVTDLSGGAVTINDYTSYAQRAAIKVDTAAILVAVTGGAADARFEQSHAGTVEEDAIQGFDISIFDIDAGAVASADIDITAISQVMEKSTGGGAFSSVGITQPTFAKADGRVYVAYRFLAAEWAVGDLYRLRVTGITAEVDGVTVYVPAMVWSNAVIEAADVKTAVDTINTEVAKIVGATGVFFEQADVPFTLFVTNVESDILDLSAASTRYILRDLILKCANPGAETVTITLYRLLDDVQTAVKTHEITASNYGQYFTLMDMFDLQHLAGDDLRISAVATAAGPYGLTGQYSYAKTNV